MTITVLPVGDPEADPEKDKDKPAEQAAQRRKRKRTRDTREPATTRGGEFDGMPATSVDLEHVTRRKLR